MFLSDVLDVSRSFAALLVVEPSRARVFSVARARPQQPSCAATSGSVSKIGAATVKIAAAAATATITLIIELRIEDEVGDVPNIDQTSKLIIFRITRTPKSIHVPDIRSVIWPVVVVQRSEM
jgi:hypothetical protein